MSPLYRWETEAERPSCRARLTGTPFLTGTRFAHLFSVLEDSSHGTQKEHS